MVVWLFSLKKQQEVKVSSARSHIQFIRTRVSQGCVRSPVLFIFYFKNCGNQKGLCSGIRNTPLC